MQHLSLRQLFITNPSRSIGLKNSLTLCFKFPGQFHNFQDKVSKSGTVPDNPGCMACMPLPNKPWFLKPVENSGKHEIGRKEQFLLSHSVFYPFRELYAIFIKCEIVVCQLFQSGRV